MKVAANRAITDFDERSRAVHHWFIADRLLLNPQQVRNIAGTTASMQRLTAKSLQLQSTATQPFRAKTHEGIGRRARQRHTRRCSQSHQLFAPLKKIHSSRHCQFNDRRHADSTTAMLHCLEYRQNSTRITGLQQQATRPHHLDPQGRYKLRPRYKVV